MISEFAVPWHRPSTPSKHSGCSAVIARQKARVFVPRPAESQKFGFRRALKGRR